MVICFNNPRWYIYYNILKPLGKVLKENLKFVKTFKYNSCCFSQTWWLLAIKIYDFLIRSDYGCGQGLGLSIEFFLKKC